MRSKLNAECCGYRNMTIRWVLVVVLFLGCCLVLTEVIESLKGQRFGIVTERCKDRTFVNQPPSNQQVLLVTYGRSGSSFTSALINHHRDVFFIFEPLYVLGNEKPQDLENYSVAILDSLMKCDVPPEHVFALQNLQFRLSAVTKAMYNCLTTSQTGVPHVTCFLKFLSDCRSHATWFAKSIRFRVEWAETLLKSKPHFKLLYLVRDPRATLLSQARNLGYFDWLNEVENASRAHCSLVENDLAEVERLFKLFPGRVKSIRYEDGATDPQAYTRGIYNFLGLEYTNETEAYIEEITRAKGDAQHLRARFGVVKKNSTDAMNSWRKTVDFNSVLKVDSVCGYLYPKLGYKFVHSLTDLETVHSLVERTNSLSFLQ